MAIPSVPGAISCGGLKKSFFCENFQAGDVECSPHLLVDIDDDATDELFTPTWSDVHSEFTPFYTSSLSPPSSASLLDESSFCLPTLFGSETSDESCADREGQIPESTPRPFSFTLSPIGNSIKVVGRSPRLEERVFYERVVQAVQDAEDLPSPIRDALKIEHVRGTYFIKSIPSSCREFISDVIAGKRGVETLQIQEVGAFKPADEVRGGANHTGDTPAKVGIPPTNEIPNETLATCLTSKGIGMHVSLKSNAFAFFQGPNKIPSHEIRAKEGFLRPFISNAKDLGRLKISNEEAYYEWIKKARVKDIQKIAIRDLSLCNCDCNEGNLLITSKGRLLEIDLGLLLSDGFIDPAILAWTKWPKARQPFTPQAKKRIEQLNFAKDRENILRVFSNYPEKNLETMEISYYLLQRGAKIGLNPFQIACFIVGDSASALGTLYNRVRNIEDPKHVCSSIKANIEAVLPVFKKDFRDICKNAKKKEGSQANKLHEDENSLKRKFVFNTRLLDEAQSYLNSFFLENIRKKISTH